MAAVMLSPFTPTTSNNNASAAPGTNNDWIDDRDPPPQTNYTSRTIEIKRKAYNKNHADGIIMNDRQTRPSGFQHGKQMADAPDVVAAGHTGWSVEGSVCERIITHYDRIYQNGMLVEMRPRYQSTWHYGRDPYGQALGGYRYNTFNQRDTGSLSTYANQLNQKYSHLGISNWHTVRGELRGVDYWNIEIMERFYPPSAALDGSCETGDTRIYYSNNEIIMEGEVQVEEKDPTKSKPSPGRNNGDVEGEAYWELVRHNENANSGVDAYLSLTIAGDHFAVRNAKQKLEIGGQSKEGKTELKIRVPDGMTVKNQDMKYSFTYEYTNDYKDIYRCTDREYGYCYEWTFDKRVPDWEKVKTFNYSGSTKIDHRMKEVITGAKIEDLFKEYKVGHKDTIVSKTQTDKQPFYEDFSKASGNTHESHYDLKTQTPIPITPGALAYGVSVPSDSHTQGGYKVLRKEGTHGHLYPADVDTSLKEQYRNRTDISGYDFAIPYQQSSLTDRGASGGKRVLNWDYASDLFYMTKHTGFQRGYPYAQAVKQNYMNGTALPTRQAMASVMDGQISSAYTAQTNQRYIDELLPSASDEDFKKLQRYVIPVEASSPLQPGVTHKNHNALHNLGLNDLTFRFDQSFQFERFLFGAVQDEAWLIEQIDPMSSISNMNGAQIHKITIKEADIDRIVAYTASRTNNRVHEFRISDRAFIQEIKNIVGY